MINYRYMCYNCETVSHRLQPPDDSKSRIKCVNCGKMARKTLCTNVPPTKGWPKVSSGLFVDSEDMAGVQKMYAEKGVSCQHDKEGNAILESRAHRKQVMEARGMIDRDGGIGDATPTNNGIDQGEKHEYIKM